jgi:hypothetical protein
MLSDFRKVNGLKVNLFNDDLYSILTRNMEVENFTAEKNLHENHRWAVN